MEGEILNASPAANGTEGRLYAPDWLPFKQEYAVRGVGRGNWLSISPSKAGIGMERPTIIHPRYPLCGWSMSSFCLKNE
jgi:hypothetical protein